MQPYLWVWILGAPVVFALIDLATTGSTRAAPNR